MTKLIEKLERLHGLIRSHRSQLQMKLESIENARKNGVNINLNTSIHKGVIESLSGKFQETLKQIQNTEL